MMRNQLLVIGLLSLGLFQTTTIAQERKERQILSGTLYVFGNVAKTPKIDKPCEPLNYEGYSDLVFGTTLTVRNGKGEIIATKKIPSGTQQYYADYDDVMVCEVTIPNIKLPDSNFYSFTLGNRNELVYSKQQLTNKNWNLELTIGLN